MPAVPAPVPAPEPHPPSLPEAAQPVQLSLVPPAEIQPPHAVPAPWVSQPAAASVPASRPAAAASRPAPAAARSARTFKWFAAWAGKIGGWRLPLACGAAGIILTVAFYEGVLGVSRRLGSVQAQLRAAQTQAAQFEKQAEDAELKLLNVQTGVSQMNKVFSELKTPPPQPQYLRLPTGVLVFWIDGMLWRRYHFYQAKGAKKTLQRATKRSTQRNFMYLPDLEPGMWRFGITALDREGNETEMSEILEVKIQP